MNVPDPVPTPGRGFSPNGAAASAGAAGAATVIVVWVVQTIWHVTIPDNVQAALITLGCFAGVWLHPQGRSPKG